MTRKSRDARFSLSELRPGPSIVSPFTVCPRVQVTAGESVLRHAGCRSICRYSEIYRDAGLGFYRLPSLVVRLEVPLLHGLARSRGKNCRAAEHLNVLNAAGLADQSFQHDRALDFHLLGEKRIA